jgi:hypothetical protein
MNMSNDKDAREKRRVNRANDPREGKFWEKWFTNPDVVWIKPEKQRTVTINAGRKVEWFKKQYPGKEPITLTKKLYNPDLPQNLTGKIVATTGVTGKDGIGRPKPIGTYYELFEAAGYRQWVNPQDYGVKRENNPRFDKRKNKKVRRKPQGRSRRAS